MNRLQIIVAQLLGQYRKQAIMGGIGLGGGLLLIVCAWFALNWIFAPSVPDPKAAPAEEVATFLCHKRGLARLPIPKRKQFLGETFDYYGKNPARRDMLADMIEQMAPSERVVIREAVFEIAKEEFMIDAKQFLKLPDDKKEEFIEKKIEAYESARNGLQGRGATGKNIGESFMHDPGVPSRSDAWAKALVSRTSARERAMAKPYMDKLSEAVEQRKADSKKAKKKGDWWKG